MCFFYYFWYSFKHLFVKRASMHGCRIVGVAHKYRLMGKGLKGIFFCLFFYFLFLFQHIYILNSSRKNVAFYVTTTFYYLKMLLRIGYQYIYTEKFRLFKPQNFINLIIKQFFRNSGTKTLIIETICLKNKNRQL